MQSTDFAGIDAYWRAASYLTVGQIYLQDNPLLREPLQPDHIKPRRLGHWGTSPGLSFIYVHLNSLVRETEANVIYLAGPGHGRRTSTACGGSSGSAPRRVASRATSACRRRGRFTKEASSDTSSFTRSAPPSTIPI